MSHARHLRAFVLAVAVAVATLAAMPLAAQAEVSGGVTIPPFYDPPATLPAANGALVRTQPLKLGVGVALPGMSGGIPATATRLMYKSTDSSGRPVAVTGTYFEPFAKHAGSGPRPLVTFSVGTQGQGDQCAPSLGFERPLIVTPSTVQTNYEIPNVYALLARGVAVVVTDYVGLGTTDRLHTYVNRLDEAHAVLDAARAARRVSGSSVKADSRLATYGYSQGGGASAAAAELQPSYAPDLKLVGGYAGAPPADLGAVLKSIDGTALVGAIGWSVNGFAQSYPQLRPVLDANINAAGRAALSKLETQCTGDAISSFAFKKTSSWTNSGQSLSTVIAANPSAQSVLDQQRIGRLKPTAPIRVSTGTKDDYVDHGQARQLAVDWCAKGANVTYVPITQLLPGGGTGVNHITPVLTDGTAAQNWVIDRLDGKPATSNCAGVGSAP